MEELGAFFSGRLVLSDSVAAAAVLRQGVAGRKPPPFSVFPQRP